MYAKCIHANMLRQSKVRGDAGMNVAQLLQDLGLGCRSALCSVDEGQLAAGSSGAGFKTAA